MLPLLRAVGHQIRSTSIPVGKDVRWALRPSHQEGPRPLKDSFDVEHLSKIAPYTRQRLEFHVGQLDAKVDVALIAAWWMLREIEVSNARFPNLRRKDRAERHLHVMALSGLRHGPQAYRGARSRPHPHTGAGPRTRPASPRPPRAHGGAGIVCSGTPGTDTWHSFSSRSSSWAYIRFRSTPQG